MFDIYHMQLLHGEVADLFKNALDIIGHIQFASVPHRGAPDEGVLDFHHLFHEIKKRQVITPLWALNINLLMVIQMPLWHGCLIGKTPHLFNDRLFPAL